MQLFKGQEIIGIIFCNKCHYQSSMVQSGNESNKISKTNIWTIDDEYQFMVLSHIN